MMLRVVDVHGGAVHEWLQGLVSVSQGRQSENHRVCYRDTGGESNKAKSYCSVNHPHLSIRHTHTSNGVGVHHCQSVRPS